MKIDEEIKKIKDMGIKNYFNSLFMRPFGKDIKYSGEGDFFITAEKDHDVYFNVTKNGKNYTITVTDIVFAIRYVKFLAIYITFLFLILALILLFKS